MFSCCEETTVVEGVCLRDCVVGSFITVSAMAKHENEAGNEIISWKRKYFERLSGYLAWVTNCPLVSQWTFHVQRKS